MNDSHPPSGRKRITTLDQAVDKEKYDKNYDRIFKKKKGKKQLKKNVRRK